MPETNPPRLVHLHSTSVPGSVLRFISSLLFLLHLRDALQPESSHATRASSQWLALFLQILPGCDRSECIFAAPRFLAALLNRRLTCDARDRQGPGEMVSDPKKNPSRFGRFKSKPKGFIPCLIPRFRDRKLSGNPSWCLG